MIRWTIFDSPLGPVGIAATEKGICQIEFNVDRTAFGRRWQERSGQKADYEPARFERLVGELQKYFQGKPVKFNEKLDFGSATPFAQRVWQATLRIPRGRTKTYREIARSIGKPRAYRAVGQALRKNPIPVIVPCHRVVGQNGRLVGFRGGINLKGKLLELEGVRLKKRQKVVRPIL